MGVFSVFSCTSVQPMMVDVNIKNVNGKIKNLFMGTPFFITNIFL